MVHAGTLHHPKQGSPLTIHLVFPDRETFSKRGEGSGEEELHFSCRRRAANQLHSEIHGSFEDPAGASSLQENPRPSAICVV